MSIALFISQFSCSKKFALGSDFCPQFGYLITLNTFSGVSVSAQFIFYIVIPFT